MSNYNYNVFDDPCFMHTGHRNTIVRYVPAPHMSLFYTGYHSWVVLQICRYFVASQSKIEFWQGLFIETSYIYPSELVLFQIEKFKRPRLKLMAWWTYGCYVVNMCCLTPALHVYSNISNIAWDNIGDDYDDDKADGGGGGGGAADADADADYWWWRQWCHMMMNMIIIIIIVVIIIIIIISHHPIFISLVSFRYFHQYIVVNVTATIIMIASIIINL